MKKLMFFIIPFVFMISGCTENPVGALIYHDPNESIEWTDTFIIYDDIIRTRGSFDPLMFTNWVEVGAGTLDFDCTDKKHKGTKSIKMTWTGKESAPYIPPGPLQTDYVGFGMSSMGLYHDISEAGYTKMELWIMGEIRDNVQLEIKVAINTAGQAAAVEYLTSADIPNDKKWHKVTIDFTNPDALKAVEVVFAISMKAISSGVETNGANIYIDEIRFLQ